MQNKGNSKKKTGPQPVYKPHLRGSVASRKAARRGWRVFGFFILFSVVSVLIGSVLTSAGLALRLGVNLLIVAGCGFLLYSDGSRQGETDVAAAEIAQNRLNTGRPVPESEKDGCFHPGKGFFTALVGALPFFVLAVVFAILAKKQYYTVGALPSWVTAYQGEASIGQPLAFYNAGRALAVEDVLRLIVRFLLFPFVNIVGANDVEGLYLVDKLSPLLCLITPLCYGLGYLRGPALRALVHGNIRLNRRRHDNRERKARQARAKRSADAKKELV